MLKIGRPLLLYFNLKQNETKKKNKTNKNGNETIG